MRKVDKCRPFSIRDFFSFLSFKQYSHGIAILLSQNPLAKQFCMLRCLHKSCAPPKVFGITTVWIFVLNKVFTMFLQTRQTALFSATQTSKVFFCYLRYCHSQFLLLLNYSYSLCIVAGSRSCSSVIDVSCSC